MITRKTALKRIFGLAIGGFFLFSFAKSVFADFAFDWVGNEMFLFRDDASSVWGTPGNIELGGDVEIDMFSKVTKKVNFGTLANKIGTASFGGIVDANESGLRGFTTTTGSLSNPPTDAELDDRLGAPTILEAGWWGFIEDTTDNQYWLCWTDGTSWFFEELTKAT